MYENPFDERFLIIAEKPSVAVTIASALGFKEKKDGYIEGPDGVVTWCFGHLAEYALPEEYNEKYRRWTLEDLPIIPDEWKLTVPDSKKKQCRLLCGLLTGRIRTTLSDGNGLLVPRVSVVNACDAGREGELIFNRVYELSGSRLPVRRLWISSMEDDAILQGFMSMKDASEYSSLAMASVCRAQADWLVGMNASRAFTKAYGRRYAVGRVQSPTLAMLAKRSDEIADFQKEQYFVTRITADSEGHRFTAFSERFKDREEANRLAGSCRNRMVFVQSVDRREKTVRPPKLYDLTTLQRDANRLFGFSASKTLSCAQNLYENRLITYPRTDSRYLTDDMEKTALDVLSACRKAFPFLTLQERSHGDSPGTESFGRAQPGNVSFPKPDVRRLLNSRKVSDHHAIIPTVMVRSADLSSLSADEERILSLIAARLACAAGQDHVYEAVKASILCCGYTFTAAGRTVKQEGWMALDAAMRRHCHAGSDQGQDKDGDGNEKDSAGSDEMDSGSDQDLSSLYRGAQFMPASVKVTEHWTQPPKPYTEDTLLHAMETAGASDMDAEVERKGLGTPATRAAVIDRLVSSGYVVRSRRRLVPTDAGKELVSILPDYLKSAQMTADWENRLLEIERGRCDSSSFMAGIREMILRLVQECRETDAQRSRMDAGQEGTGSGDTDERPGGEAIGKCPLCGSPVYERGKVFCCSDRKCAFVLWKKNRFLDRMKASLDADMAKDLLEKGRTRADRLYSTKKDRYFSADLCMEWKDGKAQFSLDFPDRSRKE